MDRLLRAELRRLSARRLFRIVSLVVLGVTLLAGINFFRIADALVYRSDAAGVLRSFGGFAAVAAFVIGASASGAEWAAGTMQALLFWEPRRVRVIAAKLLAVAALVALLSVVAQVLIGVLAYGAAAARDTAGGLDGAFWRTVTGALARGVGLAAFTGTLGFSIAMLTRGTAGALGTGFIYFSILENVLRGVVPRFTPYSLSAGLAGWVTGGFDATGVRVGLWRGGLTLVIYGVIIGGAATALFARRDVT